MDLQEEVCEKIPGTDIKLFREKVKEWVHNGVIIAKRISEKDGNVILVVDRKTKFEVYRFFPSGAKWQVSADLSSGSVAEAFETIFCII
jgi:uncharacterized UPF0160 family protein